MTETEGVIKYSLQHLNKAIDNSISINDINCWRTLLFKLQLIGQIKDRYEGYGFGNISQRFKQSNSDKVEFIISGTQTGGIETLFRKHYCHVKDANPSINSIISIGETKPSSEALTHASVYQHDKSIQAVIHIHCPKIWTNTHTLKIAHTSTDIAYGTPAMADEVARLMQTEQLKTEQIFTMLGHEDGVVAFSDNIEKAALVLIQYYAKAIKVEQTKL